MNGDKLIRTATAGVVTAVAGFAAVVSYSHIYDLGSTHGQYGTAGRLLPLAVDGIILAASLVLLHEARNGRTAPLLARCALWAGAAATLGANALYGAAWGVLGVVLSALPGASFVGCVELLMGMVARARSARQPAQVAQAEWQATQIERELAQLALAVTRTAWAAVRVERRAAQVAQWASQDAPAVAQDAPADPAERAVRALRETTLLGFPASGRQLAARYGLTAKQLAEVQSRVLVTANGHGAPR